MTSYSLRRAERALSNEETLSVLDQAAFLTISTIDADGEPYAVPLSFARRGKSLYIHSTDERGHKLDNFAARPTACGTAVIDVVPRFVDGDFTTSYESAFVCGSMRTVDDAVEKRHALVALCMKYLPEHKADIGSAMAQSIDRTAVFALDIDRLSGKANRPTAAVPLEKQEG